MKRSLLEAMAHYPLLGDGAMGTQLMAAGMIQGECGELWNLEHPDRVEAIQRRYVMAGSDCIITNTFGASALALAHHGLEDRTEAINQAGVAIARRAFGERPGYVLGDVGPFGGLIAPWGEVEAEAARRSFERQARALVEAGVDAIVIETQAVLEELGEAIAAAKAAGAPCIIGSVTYNPVRGGQDFRTMMGTTPEAAAQFMAERGVDILATNCGKNMGVAEARKIVERYRAVSALPIMVQPNAGQPVLEGTTLLYHETPGQMAEGVAGLLDAGATLVGGCCGTSPEHIEAFRRAVDAWCAANGRAPRA